jgi:hypothetical protein
MRMNVAMPPNRGVTSPEMGLLNGAMSNLTS